MNHIDLHMHSYYSLDGEYSPEDLIRLSAERGLTTVALSDHNCIRGVKEAQEAGKKYGLTVIPAVELDCICQDIDLHLLGYGIDISDSRYIEYEESILIQKAEVSEKQMEILQKAGIYFDKAEVMKQAKQGVVTGEMIAETALADKRNENNPLLMPYRQGGERSDNPYVNFFWDYCAQGKCAFLPVSYMSFEDALRLIMETGGTAVIAHPVNTVGHREELISQMAAMGVRGLEVYSSYHSEEEIAYYKNIAENMDLIMTMGSDFHGKTKPSVSLADIEAGEQEGKLEKFLVNMHKNKAD